MNKDKVGKWPYNENYVFTYLGDNGILLCIKEIMLESDGWKKGNTLRDISILAQKNDLQRWKDSIVVYGQRSSLKQCFFYKANVWWWIRLFRGQTKNIIHERCWKYII